MIESAIATIAGVLLIRLVGWWWVQVAYDPNPRSVRAET